MRIPKTRGNMWEIDMKITSFQLLAKVKEHMSEGISIQRSAYMRQCLTVQEMQTIA